MSTSYSASEFQRLSWEQYQKILETLADRVIEFLKAENLSIGAIVPILRGGAFPGTYLAFKLNMIRMIPVQYKYFFDTKLQEAHLKRLLPLPADFSVENGQAILVVENCYCFGQTTRAVVREIREKAPLAKIIVAADRADYVNREIQEADAFIPGEFTNDCKMLSIEDCKKLKIDPIQWYYPWETLEEELTTCNAGQHKFTDLEFLATNPSIAVNFDLKTGEKKVNF